MKKYFFKILILVALIAPLKTFAFLPNFSVGGRILHVDFCECQAGFVVLFLDNKTGIPIPTPILFQPGFSSIHAVYAFIPGGSLLGTATPGGACAQVVSRGLGGSACVPLPLIGTFTPFPMSGVGTALPPIF
jgi:hypothetical protein